VTGAQKRKRILALVAAWQGPLDLGNWTLNVVFDCTTPERASCCADPEYRTAKLTFNTKRIGPQEIDEFVAHEMCHTHGWAIAALGWKWAGKDPVKRKVVEDAEELMTTGFSRAFLPLLPKVVTL
jgi:hypothetical protein